MEILSHGHLVGCFTLKEKLYEMKMNVEHIQFIHWHACNFSLPEKAPPAPAQLLSGLTSTHVAQESAFKHHLLVVLTLSDLTSPSKLFSWSWSSRTRFPFGALLNHREPIGRGALHIGRLTSGRQAHDPWEWALPWYPPTATTPVWRTEGKAGCPALNLCYKLREEREATCRDLKGREFLQKTGDQIQQKDFISVLAGGSG